MPSRLRVMTVMIWLMHMLELAGTTNAMTICPARAASTIWISPWIVLIPGTGFPVLFKIAQPLCVALLPWVQLLAFPPLDAVESALFCAPLPFGVPAIALVIE